jgi:hypothetical protein
MPADLGRHRKETVVNLEQLRKRAKDRLREQRRTDPEAKLSGAQRTPGAVEGFVQVGAPLTEIGARLVVARAHGLTSWPALRRHVRLLGGSGEPFFRAYQAASANRAKLADILLNAGARSDTCGRGDGGTPLVAALFWGHREVPDRLVQRCGIEPRNLRAAAGIGDLQLVEELVGTPRAGAHRGFYRPHAGFPAWSPSDDHQEVLDEALAYAARAGPVHVLTALVRHGADVDRDVYRGTPLIWAASTARAGAVRQLLVLGADPMHRGSYGGEDHGRDVTPLHLAATSGDAETVTILLDAGADPTAVDGHGYGDPAGWAQHAGHAEIAELIEARSNATG